MPCPPPSSVRRALRLQGCQAAVPLPQGRRDLPPQQGREGVRQGAEPVREVRESFPVPQLPARAALAAAALRPGPAATASFALSFLFPMLWCWEMMFSELCHRTIWARRGAGLSIHSCFDVVLGVGSLEHQEPGCSMSAPSRETSSGCSQCPHSPSLVTSTSPACATQQNHQGPGISEPFWTWLLAPHLACVQCFSWKSSFSDSKGNSLHLQVFGFLGVDCVWFPI